MFFKDKVVLVTGGAKGIGKAIGEAFGLKGCYIIIADRDEERGRQTLREFIDKGLKAEFYSLNLVEPKAIEELFNYINKQYGKIHILINNAGLSKFKPFLELTLEEWEEIINSNLRSVFLTSKEFVKLNLHCSYGRIINIASTRAFMSEPNSEAYAASKGGIVSLTHALALSLSDKKITVNSISPGWIETKNYDRLREIDHEQHPSLRVGKPEDVARMCLFLCEEHNDFINGENIIIDGGMTKKMIYEE